MTVAGGSGGDFNIGRVIGRTFTSVGVNFVNLMIITVLFVVLPSAAIAWFQLTFFAGYTFANGNWATAITGGFASLALGLVQLALNMAAQAAIFFFVVSDLSGRKATIGDALAKGLRHWWPLLMVVICTGFMSALGFLFFIVPGILLVIRWIVALPTQVVENTGVFAAMGRSADLTKGRRWSIFGLMLVVLVMVWIIELALIAVIVRPGGGYLAAPNAPLTQILVSPLIGLITTPIFCTGYASLYYELRSTKEGVGVEALASVFD